MWQQIQEKVIEHKLALHRCLSVHFAVAITGYYTVPQLVRVPKEPVLSRPWINKTLLPLCSFNIRPRDGTLSFNKVSSLKHMISEQRADLVKQWLPHWDPALQSQPCLKIHACSVWGFLTHKKLCAHNFTQIHLAGIGSSWKSIIFCYLTRSGVQGMRLWGSVSCSQDANTLTTNHYWTFCLLI